VAVETYGGGIWHSWFDRDLSLAGRVIVEDSSTGSFKSKLVKIDRPLLRIPTLAIHLDRSVNDNFKFNQETEFVPILGQVASQLNARPGQEGHKDEHETIGKAGNGINHSHYHHPAILHLLAEELSVKPEEINDFEL
jgi:aspartyl aminopeptidase